jgi:DNA-directed RNA polymerase subunit RPC12/RpoP
MRTNVKLICDNCGKEFERTLSEFKRNKREGTKLFCSRSCSSKVIIRGLRDDGKLIGDDLSPFRFHLTSIKMRLKTQRKKRPNSALKECSIILQDLKDQWDLQKGLCPYTGWKLVSPPNTTTWKRLEKAPDRASVDRIDSSKGYVKGNIQFVSLMAQYAKNMWDEKELYKFCEAVVVNKIAT